MLLCYALSRPCSYLVAPKSLSSLVCYLPYEDDKGSSVEEARSVSEDEEDNAEEARAKEKAITSKVKGGNKRKAEQGAMNEGKKVRTSVKESKRDEQCREVRLQGFDKWLTHKV